MRFRYILSIAVLCWCFTFGIFSVMLVDFINQPTLILSTCSPIEAKDSQFTVTVQASDFALSGDGTREKPYTLDERLFTDTLRRLDTVPVNKVVDGGCHYYRAGDNSIKVFSNTFISRFIVIDDGHPSPAK